MNTHVSGLMMPKPIHEQTKKGRGRGDRGGGGGVGFEEVVQWGEGGSPGSCLSCQSDWKATLA